MFIRLSLIFLMLPNIFCDTDITFVGEVDEYFQDNEENSARAYTTPPPPPPAQACDTVSNGKDKTIRTSTNTFHSIAIFDLKLKEEQSNDEKEADQNSEKTNAG